MTIISALFLVGLLDAMMGGLFWWLHCRAAAALKSWPDPGAWGEEKEVWDKVHSGAENLRVLRVVCLNTGASMMCCALMMLLGAG